MYILEGIMPKRGTLNDLFFYMNMILLSNDCIMHSIIKPRNDQYSVKSLVNL